ncbi:glycosyltransferase [Gramella sp. GC03-9]|uniref:Glycosyltransferase n=1 Tax=Christiangramia oceanisediminis TaxID=2920386 RepID=A0A9X2L090_9FLAO|nr:glycosyltransferase family 2 protein [Gramella oceanisediminis]MCP9201511.1 glycosyltransferase [Gramella oceanisediminis]
MKNNIKEPNKAEERTIKLLIVLGLFSILNFLFFFFQPDSWGNLLLFALLMITMLYSLVKKLYMWYNYSNISVPETPELEKEFSVDILTTYFPGEPYQMIITTLEAINRITYPHTAYLCDEANDPFLKKFCEDNGIVHVTRNNRKDAKAGNINNALRKAASGDICVVLDPDHIPEPDFLDEIVPHFSDPEIGFVQIVQAYYNTKETLVARGAAEQTFQFYGPMMMTLNSYGTVNAIGANCVFRRKALDSIGGHSPGLCEDMHTAMNLYSKGWKAVYVPKILAQGLAPSNLTSYFKQQLKWSRGTFDLLFKVYPKLYKDFTVRQKIHFAVLPLHYLSGVICLINFLIPIVSLLFSTTPWNGNIIDFALVLLPVIMSSLLIRTYIQKWVIDKKERGFHVIGGLLQINTWWIYILGLFYTLIDRKIPYLPTPKENEFATNLRIVVPNLVIAILSILAIIIGLRRDLTPFSIVMAGFALFNALIMFFGIYLAVKATNQNNLLKENLQKSTLRSLQNIRSGSLNIANVLFNITRKAALPLLLAAVIFAVGFKQKHDYLRWKNVYPSYLDKMNSSFLGIYHPPEDTGLVNISEIGTIEIDQNVDFDVISFYLGWNDEEMDQFPFKLMDSITEMNALPLITWEPWPSRTDDQNILQTIANGGYDPYIRQFAKNLATYDRPVFLRFAHEFDNPQYPWFKSTPGFPAEFKSAWKRLHRILKEEAANKVMMVWNPWRAEGMRNFYPGDEFVDWIGVTLLNYGPLHSNGQYYSFKELYQNFHDKLFWFTRKPVMLAEFGSVDIDGRQDEWLKEAARQLSKEFEEVKAVVMFNSAYDNNIPAGRFYKEEYIDWTTDSLGIFKSFQQGYPPVNEPTEMIGQKSRISLGQDSIKGVIYKKGLDWRDNYYVVTRKTFKKDLKLMKELGINTIQFTGGNIYDYNILKYSEDAGIKVIYQFGLPEDPNFLEDEAALNDLKQDVFEKLEDLAEFRNLKAISFDFQLEEYFNKPLLFAQRDGYLRWLKNTLIEIRANYPQLPVVLNLKLNSETRNLISEIDPKLPVDSYGLIVNENSKAEEVVDIVESGEIPVFLSSVSPKLIRELPANLDKSKIVFENWQDERKSNRLSFDGLLDFEGRKKSRFTAARSIWNPSEKPTEDLTVRILKPAIPLLTGEKLVYKAYLFHNNNWISGNKIPNDYKFEWSLIKNDIFGNPMALRKLGTGISVEVSIPEDYYRYQLLLTAVPPDYNHVSRTFSTLNMHLNP